MTIFIYKPNKSSEDPIAINMIPSEELKEYHRNSCVQINLSEGFNEKETPCT